MTPHLERTLAFLRSISIDCAVDNRATGFLRGVRIVSGALQVSTTAALEDVLHEAGHLAVLPAPFRHLANDDLEGVCKHMSDFLDTDGCDIDSPLMRAMLQSGEAEATAWAWAAGMHLGLPAEIVISDTSYGGSGTNIRAGLALGRYLGVNGLWHSGMCAAPNQPGPHFPHLLQWTQEIGDSPSDLVSPHFNRHLHARQVA